jgi:hypothetical protein
MNYEDEEELNSWIWRSNARMASHLASYNVTGPVVSAPSVYYDQVASRIEIDYTFLAKEKKKLIQQKE